MLPTLPALVAQGRYAIKLKRLPPSKTGGKLARHLNHATTFQRNNSPLPAKLGTTPIIQVVSLTCVTT